MSDNIKCVNTLKLLDTVYGTSRLYIYFKDKEETKKRNIYFHVL